jgi:hypothetical protein
MRSGEAPAWPARGGMAGDRSASLTAAAKGALCPGDTSDASAPVNLITGMISMTCSTDAEERFPT